LDEAGITLEHRIDDWHTRTVENAPPPEQVVALEAAVAGFFRTMPAEMIMREGQRRGLYVAAASTPKDLVNSPHLRARGFWETIDHPELGAAITYPGAPFKFSETPWRVSRRAPLPGEHNREIYCGELGLSARDLAVLAGTGVV
jgi:crotonobetainyl-CoA:carnitine CoA-transferase CaiB-like acyl-CoA transferase